MRKLLLLSVSLMKITRDIFEERSIHLQIYRIFFSFFPLVRGRMGFDQYRLRIVHPDGRRNRSRSRARIHSSTFFRVRGCPRTSRMGLG